MIEFQIGIFFFFFFSCFSRSFGRRAGSIYLVSVALANLLITVIAVPCSCIEIMAVAPNHPDVCALQWFLTQLAAVVTLISFALISVENFFSLFCPPSTCSRLLCSKMRILLLLLLLWTAAIMLPWLRQLYRLTPDLCAPFVHSSLSSSVVASAASAAATSTSVLPSSSSSSSSLSSSGTSSSATAASSSSALSSSSSSDLLSSASSSTASSSAPSSPSVVNSSFAVPSFSVPFAALSPNGAPTTFAAHSSVKFSFSSLLVDDHHHVGSDNAKAQLGILWPRLHLTVFVCVLCIPHLISLVFFANCAVRIKRIRQRLRAAISGTESYANYPTVAGDFALIQSNMAVNAYASISWCPLIVCVFLSAFTEFADPNLIAIAWWLAWTFSCMYSFAYALLNRDFGEAFFKLFFYCCCKSHVTFVRKSFAYRRPSISNTLAAASRRRADPSSSGESFGLRVHIIPGLNMSQRRDTFGQSGGSTGGAIGGGGGGIGGMSGSSTGYGHHSSGILRSESFGRSGPFKAYGQMGASGNSHHHHHHHHSHHPHIWSNAHKSTSGRTVYEKESESAFATSRTEHDLSNRDQRHAIGFGRTFAGAGHTTSNKFCASSKYVSDL